MNVQRTQGGCVYYVHAEYCVCASAAFPVSLLCTMFVSLVSQPLKLILSVFSCFLQSVSLYYGGNVCVCLTFIADFADGLVCVLVYVCVCVLSASL